jgi:hypothetical protein
MQAARRAAAVGKGFSFAGKTLQLSQVFKKPCQSYAQG